LDYEQQIVNWIKADDARMEALRIAASLNLNDWCIGAGFVRNLIWDKLHNYSITTPLNDIDLIYFNQSNVAEETDIFFVNELKSKSERPWSVKNQARMHIRNNDSPYCSTAHSMSYWVELETAIGVRLHHKDQLKLIAPFGLETLFSNTITINPTRVKQADFQARIQSKRWLELWPNLTVINP
jgi:hypothetical protein